MIYLFHRGEGGQADAHSDVWLATDCGHHHIQVLREVGSGRHDDWEDNLCQVQDRGWGFDTVIYNRVSIYVAGCPFM